MSYRKYLSDYRQTEQLDARGRSKIVWSYAGERFVFCAEGKKLARVKLCYAAALCVGAALYILSLLQNGVLTRRIWVVLPQVCCLLPLFFAANGVGLLLFVRKPLTREQNDHVSHRAKLCTLLLGVFSGAAFLSGAVTAVCLKNSLVLPDDALFLIFAALLSADGWWMFHCYGKLATRPVTECGQPL